MSTPIGQLGIGSEQPMYDQHPQGGMNSPADASMMSQVLEQVQGMDDNNDPHSSNISGEMMSHNMDPSQIPPEQQYNYMPEEPMHYNNPPHLVEEDESWSQKIQSGVKGPFIVFLIALVINLPQVTRFLTHFVPSLLYESGQLNLYGVALKAILCAVMYALISYAAN
jgi:hypothetical protein